MNYNNLAKVGVQKVSDSTKKEEILDALRKRREAKKIQDSKKYANFKVTDSFKNLKKKIKDALEETESTEDAIEVAIEQITPETPAEEVVAAVTEVLAETIDELQEQIEEPKEIVEDPEEIVEVTDSKAEFNVLEKFDRLKHKKKILDLVKLKKSEDWEWAPDGEVRYKGNKVGIVNDEDLLKKCIKLNELIAKTLGTSEFK